MCHRRCSETHPTPALSQLVVTTAPSCAASSRETDHKHGRAGISKHAAAGCAAGSRPFSRSSRGSAGAAQGQQRGQPRRNPQPHTHLHDDSLTPRVAAGEHQHHLPRLHKLAHLCRRGTRRSTAGSGRSQPSRSRGWRQIPQPPQLTGTAAPMAPRRKRKPLPLRRPFTPRPDVTSASSTRAAGARAQRSGSFRAAAGRPAAARPPRPRIVPGSGPAQLLVLPVPAGPSAQCRLTLHCKAERSSHDFISGSLAAAQSTPSSRHRNPNAIRNCRYVTVILQILQSQVSHHTCITRANNRRKLKRSHWK